MLYKESSLFRFIKSSSIFLLGMVLSKAISILMLPLYTNHIPINDMGYYDLSLTYITIATSFFFFDIWVAILRYMYDGNTEIQQATSIKSGFAIFTLSSTMYLALGVVLSIIIKPNAIQWILMYGLFQNIASLLSFCARGFQKNTEFALSGIINSLFNVVCNMVFILGLNMGYESLYISAIIGFIAQSVYLLIFGKIFRSLKIGKFDKATAKSIFKYSLPLCLNSVAYWVLTSFNRIVLNVIYGSGENGIYAIGNKFSFVVGLITTCFTYAWQDLSFSKSNGQGVGKFYSNASSMYSKVLIVCTSLALPVIKIIFPILVGKSYSSAENTIPLFLIIATVSAISTFIGNIFYAIKETKMIFFSMVISALVNLVLCYPLITFLGINGANISVLISFIVNILVRCVVLRKKISFTMDKRIFYLLLPMLISIISFIYFDWKLNILVLIAMLVIMALYFKSYIKPYMMKIKQRKGNNV